MDCTNVRYSKENHVDKCKGTSNHGIRNTRGSTHDHSLSTRRVAVIP